jgi:hypothetical protein
LKIFGGQFLFVRAALFFRGREKRKRKEEEKRGRDKWKR